MLLSYERSLQPDHFASLGDSVASSTRMRFSAHTGILIGRSGPYDSRLKIRPPLCFSKENADMFVTVCEDELQEPRPSPWMREA
jgi:hypothetical protein